MRLDGKWIEVFRVSDYGGRGRYTERDLDSIIASYNPAKHEAPIVLGHPENNAPAYGWVESLKRVGGTLLAKLKQVAPELEAWIAAGRYKKRSVSLYTKPHLALRHVGFLGAFAPEVKGLADVCFAEQVHDEYEFVERGLGQMEKINFVQTQNDTSSYFVANADLAQEALDISNRDNISYAEALTQARALRRED